MYISENVHFLRNVHSRETVARAATTTPDNTNNKVCYNEHNYNNKSISISNDTDNPEAATDDEKNHDYTTKAADESQTTINTHNNTDNKVSCNGYNSNNKSISISNGTDNPEALTADEKNHGYTTKATDESRTTTNTHSNTNDKVSCNKYNSKYKYNGTSESNKAYKANNDIDTLTNNNDADDDDDDKSDEHDGMEYDEMINDAIEFNEVHGDSSNNDIEMWDAGENHIHDEKEDEQGDVCALSVDEGSRANVFAIGVQPRTNKVSVCPGRKRRIVKVTQWSASARANMIRALREQVTQCDGVGIEA